METRRLDAVWIGLVVATVIAVVIGEVLHDSSSGAAVGTVLVFAVAAVKVRFVAMELMGLRHASRTIVMALHAWLVAVLVALATIYLLRR